MKATNIQWDIDMEDALAMLDEMTAKDAAEALEISYDRYANMTSEERDDYAYDFFHHRPGALCDFVGLPDEVDIPEELTDEEDIADWLSDEYGFCHDGFCIEE